MLVLVIPPMKPGPADDLDSHNEGKRQRSRLARLAQIIGLTVGVPVWVPHIQTFKTETRAWIYRSPKWNNECLFNAENRICREYTSRLGAEISDVIINKARPQISLRYRWYGCGLNFPLVINYRGGGIGLI
jgi:hypothetical protein